MITAGYVKTTKTAEVVSPLKREITDRASIMLAMNAHKAAFGNVDVLNDPSSLDARNAIPAARVVLDRSGLMYAVFAPTVLSQSLTASAMNSGPLSERM